MPFQKLSSVGITIPKASKKLKSGLQRGVHNVRYPPPQPISYADADNS